VLVDAQPGGGHGRHHVVERGVVAEGGEHPGGLLRGEPLGPAHLHDDSPPPGAQDPAHLGEGAREVGHEGQHLPAPHHVDGRVGHGDRLGHTDGQREGAGCAPGHLEGSAHRVHADDGPAEAAVQGHHVAALATPHVHGHRAGGKAEPAGDLVDHVGAPGPEALVEGTAEGLLDAGELVVRSLERGVHQSRDVTKTQWRYVARSGAGASPRAAARSTSEKSP
jgi:hypothetical protein